jgi:hypothetical protein
MSTDQYPEISGEESRLVPPQDAHKADWPKKIRTLSAAELDRLTIDGLGRFYWDGQLVNYEAHSSRLELQPVDLDRSAMELLDRAARELSDPTGTEQASAVEAQKPAEAIQATDQSVPVAAVAAVAAAAPVVVLGRGEPARALEAPILVRSDKVRVSLSAWQSIGLILVILGFVIGALGVAAHGWVAANEWGCRVGLVKDYCPPPPPAPKAPARADIPA